MLTITTTRYFQIANTAILQEKVVRLFGLVIYRWQERQAQGNEA